MQSKTILVENIKCAGCAKTVQNALLKIGGIQEVKVDLEEGWVIFSGEGELPTADVVKRLGQLGYPQAGTGSQLQKVKSFVSCALGRVS